MNAFEALSILFVTSAVFSWINHRWLRLPTTIGVMLVALALSLLLFALDAVGVGTREHARDLLERVDFSHALLDVMLAFLLFAGALHVRAEDLWSHRRVIAGLATLGVVVSTLLVAGFIRLLAEPLGLELPWMACLIFGALISPTDPIAVLGILRVVGAPKSLETKITGESLFNDGVGVVVFTMLIAIAAGGHGGEAFGVLDGVTLFLREVLGSIVLGLAFGWLAFFMLRQVDGYQVEVLITLALCTGVYSLAAALHSSGPLAVVVAGLLMGNRGRLLAMSESTVEHLDTFWELVDGILNVVLFVLLGLELLVVPFASAPIIAGLAAIPLVLLARFLAVGGAVTILRRWRTFSPGVVKILTWGGLRGGISVALALSVPIDLPGRDAILTMTYLVVIFSVAVQGLTIGKLVRRESARIAA